MNAAGFYDEMKAHMDRLEAHVQTLDARVHITYHLGEGAWVLYAPRPEGEGWLERVDLPIERQDLALPLDSVTDRYLLPGLAVLQRRLAEPREAQA